MGDGIYVSKLMPRPAFETSLKASAQIVTEQKLRAVAQVQRPVQRQECLHVLR